MKILLVRPYPELRVAQRLEEGFLRLEPLNLEIVAGGAHPDDEVKILDLGLHPRPLQTFDRTLQQASPDVIGFTGYSSHARQIKRLAGIAKKHLPEVINVVGGIHATILPGDYAVDVLDIIVRGEGGTALHQILHRLKSGRPAALVSYGFK